MGEGAARLQCLVCLRHSGEDQAGLKKKENGKKGKSVIPTNWVVYPPLRCATAHPALDVRDKVLGRPTAGTMEARSGEMVGGGGRCGDV